MKLPGGYVHAPYDIESAQNYLLEFVPAIARLYSSFSVADLLENSAENPAMRINPKSLRIIGPRPLASALVLLALSACAYPHYVNDEYRYIPLTTFAHDNRSFRIFDKPSAGKLVITPSLSTAVSDVVIRNATFGKYNNSIELQALSDAVIAYLAGQGRKCVITGSSLMYDPQWEFTYDCEMRYTAMP